MICAHCGNAIQDGHKFCYHCGMPAQLPEPPQPTPSQEEPAGSYAESQPDVLELLQEPEMAAPPQEPEPFAPPCPAEMPTEPLPQIETPSHSGPQDEVSSSAGEKPVDSETVSLGRLFWLELLCYIPVINFIVLTALALSGKNPWRARLAQAKVLAMMTVLLICLAAVLTLIMLIYLEVIPPLYLGRWNS